MFVFKLDRLSRTGVADTFEVVNEMRKAGCTLVAVADELTIVADREDITSEVLVFAFSLAARIERGSINDRVSAARDRLEAQGGRWGRPSRVDRATRERAVELAAAGRSVRDIARALHVPRSTIARAIASQKGAHAKAPDPPKDPPHE